MSPKLKEVCYLPRPWGVPRDKHTLPTQENEPASPSTFLQLDQRFPPQFQKPIRRLPYPVLEKKKVNFLQRPAMKPSAPAFPSCARYSMSLALRARTRILSTRPSISSGSRWASPFKALLPCSMSLSALSSISSSCSLSTRVCCE